MSGALRSALLRGAVAGLWLLLAPTPARPDGVAVSLVASSQTITPGAEFDLTIQCTSAGAVFNGFSAVVTWDPAALTCLPLSPLSQQEGTYMKSACGSTFHRFHTGAVTDTITDVLLCNGVSLSGPGDLYRLRFRASNTPQVTTVQFTSLQFYNAGRYVHPVSSTGLILGIGTSVSVGPDGSGVLRLALSATPNPGRGPLALSLEADRAGVQRVRVSDVQGRTVDRLAEGWFPAGQRQLNWDGRDDTGRRLPAGVYLVTLEVAGRTAARRVVLLP